MDWRTVIIVAAAAVVGYAAYRGARDVVEDARERGPETYQWGG